MRLNEVGSLGKGDNLVRAVMTYYLKRTLPSDY